MPPQVSINLLKKIESVFGISEDTLKFLMPSFIVYHGDNTIISNNIITLVLPIPSKVQNKRTFFLEKTLEKYENAEVVDFRLISFKPRILNDIKLKFDDIDWKYVEIRDDNFIFNVAIGNMLIKEFPCKIYLQGNIFRVQ